MSISRWITALTCTLVLASCGSSPTTPLETVKQLDLSRYVGDWYVIANIPPWIEKGAHNSVESYRLDPDGTIATTFTWRVNGFDGEERTLKSTAYVLDRQSNAVWGVQFLWPIKADYRITHISPDYSQTIVSREKRDWVWIMARTPAISDADYQRLAAIVASQGYDMSRLEKVPQKWK